MPRLDRLTVRGFKSIRKLEDFELGSLNVLIGPNGAGKSNFIDVIRMLDSVAARRFQVFVAQQGGPDALLFGGRKRTESIDLRFFFGAKEYAISLIPVSNRMVMLKEEVRGSASGISSLGSGHYESNMAAKEDFGDIFLHPFPGAASAPWRAYHFLDTSSEARVLQAQDIRDNVSLKEDGANLGPILRRIRERFPENYRKITETIRLVAPFFGDFVYRKDAGERVELEWFSAHDPDTVLGPGQFSDGTLRFICLATLLRQPTELQPEMIVIDEPELGLHPSAISLLAEMLLDASDTRQVVISTQSADLVDEFEADHVVVVGRKDDATTFTRMDSERLADWLEDYALGDLWKMNILGGRPA
ncbi:MAG: AAA family ATPase [Gammaproteobacteria bacterium]|nr:AAA family ATPase [Gammaproteobacteria bacterium]